MSSDQLQQTDEDQTETTAPEDSDSVRVPAGDDGSSGSSVVSGPVALGLLLLKPFLWVWSKIPRSSAVADQMVVSGFQLKKNLSNCDAIVMVIYDDKVTIPKAGYYDKESGEIVTKDGDRAAISGEGHHPYQINGKVPVVWTLAATPEALSPVQAFIAQQRDLGRWAEFQGTDGDDHLVVDSQPPGDNSQMVLSFEKAWEMFWQQIDQQDLEEQYDLGYEEGLEGDQNLWAYVLGSFIGGIVLTVAMLIVLQWASGMGGGGGGGGGSLLPMISPALPTPGWW